MPESTQLMHGKEIEATLFEIPGFWIINLVRIAVFGFPIFP